MDERDYKAMNKELQEETEKNCIGCKFLEYLMNSSKKYCKNTNSAKSGFINKIGKGPSCELKQIKNEKRKHI
jgi:hypothetical protein